MKFLGINTKSWSNGFVRSLRAWNRNRLEERSRTRVREEEADTLCVLGIFKNEELALDEWIQHYIWLGADKIILIDNGSTDGSADRIKAWRNDDRVSCIRLDQPHRQTEHYWTAIKHFEVRQKWKWLLIADLDEFWFVKNGQPLKNKLAEYETLDVVYCNWSVFGCPNEGDHPKSLRKELCFKQADLGGHRHRKYLVRAKKLTKSSMIEIHTIKGLDSARTVSDNATMQINHYYTQSQIFWKKVKMTRGDAFDPMMDRFRVMEVFKDVNSRCTVEDTVLADLIRKQ